VVAGAKPSRSSGPVATRPNVSVCMATFQGERFVEEQIASILPQLASGDEVVIVDDGSTDSTAARIRSIGDGRIRLYTEEVNRGVLCAFERAVRLAKGAVIFLSDQDDLWEPTKVSIVLRAFQDNEEVQLVISDASIINDRGEKVADSYFAWRGEFRDGFFSNLFRSKFHGCVMAFRSSLVPKILPFPLGTRVLHDIWIGSRNRLSGGRTVYIDDQLVRYRRHSANVTGMTHRRQTRIDQLRSRLDLLFSIATFRREEKGGEGSGRDAL